MDTSAKDCLVLFDTSVEGKLACGWESGVLHQRTRTVKAGPMVYVDCYPVWDTAHARAASTEQDSTGLSSRKTVHKPQLEVSQPRLTLRHPCLRTKSMSSVSGATSSETRTPFSIRLICI